MRSDDKTMSVLGSHLSVRVCTNKVTQDLFIHEDTDDSCGLIPEI